MPEITLPASLQDVEPVRSRPHPGPARLHVHRRRRHHPLPRRASPRRRSSASRPRPSSRVYVPPRGADPELGASHADRGRGRPGGHRHLVLRGEPAVLRLRHGDPVHQRPDPAGRRRPVDHAPHPGDPGRPGPHRHAGRGGVARRRRHRAHPRVHQVVPPHRRARRRQRAHPRREAGHRPRLLARRRRRPPSWWCATPAPAWAAPRPTEARADARHRDHLASPRPRPAARVPRAQRGRDAHARHPRRARARST